MRSKVLLLVAGSITSFLGLQRAGAQTMGDPISVPVHFATSATFDIYNDVLWHSVTVYGEPSSPSATDGELDIGGHELSRGVARLQPNQVYDVIVDDESTTESNFTLSPPPGFSATINGMTTRTIDTTGGGVFAVVITPDSQVQAAHAGVASSPSKDRVYWQVSTGFLQDGTSAGWVSISDLGYGADLSDIFTPAALSYSSPSPIEVTVYNDPITQNLSQVKTPEGCMSVIVDSATSYELDFYSNASISNSSPPYTFSTGYYIKYVISEGSSASQITITSTTYNSGGTAIRTAVTSITRSGTAWPYTWSVQDWHTSGAAIPVSSQVVCPDPPSSLPGPYTETATVFSPTQTALTTYLVYYEESWGMELTNQVLGSTTGSQDTTNYQFYGDSSSTNDYGFVQAVSDNGHWTGYEYRPYDDGDSVNADNDGIVSAVHTQYYNSSTTIPGDLSSDSSGAAVTAYTYTKDIFGIYSLPTTIQTTLAGTGTVIGEANISYDGITDSVTLNGMNVVTTSRQDTVNTPTGTTTLSSGTLYYRENNYDEFFRGKTCSVTHADQTKDCFVYQRGGLVSGTPTFSGLNSNGGLYSQEAVIHGAASGTSACTSYAGCDVDTVYLVPNESTMDITIRDDSARVIKTETAVWDGGAWDTVKWAAYTYDSFSNQMLTKTTSDNRSLTNTYNGQQLSAQTDTAGIVTTYAYDDAGRVQTEVENAANSSLSFKTKTTTFAYDAAGHVVAKATSDTSGNSIGVAAGYDDAGRLSSQTDINGATTSYAYNLSSLTTTATLPGGATKVDVTLPDGHLASETGTGVVSTYYTYSTGSNGELTATIDYGASSSNRQEQTITDMLGRVVSTSHPTFGNASTYTLTDSYNSLGQLVEVSQSGGGASMANTLYQYDAMGRRVDEALSLSGGTGINFSSDRVTQTTQAIASDTSGNYWAVTTTSTYPPSSGTAFATGIERDRLTGLGAGELADTQVVDSYGNVTETTVFANTADNTITSKTAGPGIASGSTANTVTVAGLTLSQCGYDGLSTTYAYDSLWRPVSQTNSRGKTTSTSYVSDTTRPLSVVDASGATIATYGYDSAGRVTSVENAGAKYTYFNYDGMNHVTQEWGDVPQPVQYSYDSYGARDEMETFQGAATYSPSGGSWSGGGTSGTTTWNYDSYTGLLAGKTDNSGYGPSYTYDGLGRVATRTWQRGAVATYSYDSNSGQLTGVSYSGDGGVTTGLSYSYNRLGQLTSVSDATGTRTFAYDESIDSNPLEFEGEHLDSTFYGGRWLSRLYDNSTGVGGSDYGTTLPGFVLGRPIGFQLGSSENSAGDLLQNYAHSEYGVFLGVYSQTQGDTPRKFVYTRLASSELVSGYSDYGHNFSANRSYDANLDLLTSIQGSFGSTVCTQYNLAYNSLRQVTSVAQTGTAFADYDGSTGSTYRLLSYDSHGQVTGDVGYLGTIGGSSTPLPDRDYAYAYDAQGNRTASNYSTDSAFQENYTIDALNQITGKTNLSVPMSGTVLSGGPGVVLSTSTSSGGAPVSLVDASVVGGFWAGEVTPPTDGSGTPSNSGGPSTFYVTATGGWAGAQFSGSETNPVNAQQRQVTIPEKSQTLSYDSDGNLHDDGIWTYTYDAENRVVKMVADSGTALTDTQLNFTYDYMGRRVEKIVSVSGSTTYDHRFVYDGWNLIGDYQVSGSTLSLYRTFTWGLDVSGDLTATGGVGALIEVTNCGSGGPSDYFPTYDGNGNVASLIRASDGTVAAAYEYSAFGQSLRAEVIDSSVGDNPFRFSSKFTDTETGLVYYGNRFYSPTLGRFVNRDPIEESGGSNLYAFCGNDGINGVDVLGYIQADDPTNPQSYGYWENIRDGEQQESEGFANSIINAANDGDYIDETDSSGQDLGDPRNFQEGESWDLYVAGTASASQFGLAQQDADRTASDDAALANAQQEKDSEAAIAGDPNNTNAFTGAPNNTNAFTGAPNNGQRSILNRVGQFSKGVLSTGLGVVGALGTMITAPAQAATGIGIGALILEASGEAGAMVYGIGNIVGAFAPDATQAQMMVNSPSSIPTLIARGVGGQSLQDQVGLAESAFNFSAGLASTGASPSSLENLGNLSNGVDLGQQIIVNSSPDSSSH